jgi:DNA-binding NarL/FixJ family response regulator
VCPDETPDAALDATPDMTLARIGVLVVDDHPIWRESVARDLQEAGMRVVGTAGDGAAAVRIAKASRPDVVLMDLQLPILSGVEATRQIVEALPTVRVLVLSASGEPPDVLTAVKAGALGYLVKSASKEELIGAVRRTFDGDPVFTAGLAGLVLGEFRRLSADAKAEEARLTDRETEILRLVAKGLTYRQISERLALSHRTVQNHVQNVLGKLHLHTRYELVRYAVRQGLDDDS